MDFTVSSNGRIAKPEGIEDLDPQQRVAWQFWASQFAYAWTLPHKGVTAGEKWKTEEPEDTPTAIANLVWERETTYVRNDKCPIIPIETCAVFLTHAKLKQKSSEEDATPDTYRLHNLKTSGTAGGSNEAIRYISLKTHLVLRAKEDAQQSMDATVAKIRRFQLRVRYLHLQQQPVRSHADPRSRPAAPRINWRAARPIHLEIHIFPGHNHRSTSRFAKHGIIEVSAMPAGPAGDALDAFQTPQQLSASWRSTRRA